MKLPDINSIKEAHKRIKPFIHNTPVLKSEILNSILGCNIVFKCENFQKAGAFKYRGASNALLNLQETDFRKGVATHSSGNHAGALAKAAQIHGTKAYIVMPENAPQVKIDAVKNYGGQITFCGNTLEARETSLQKVMTETGATFIHPFDNLDVISGQGTACLEMFEQIHEPEIVIAPVGGGGLLSGTSISAKSLWKNCKVIGAEPENAKDAHLSLKKGEIVPPFTPNTIADGLLTCLSELTFAVVSKNVDEILLVTEQGIKNAMELIFRYLKIIVEPSSAVTVGIILENKELFKDKNVAAIFSGGNFNPLKS